MCMKKIRLLTEYFSILLRIFGNIMKTCFIFINFILKTICFD